MFVTCILKYVQHVTRLLFKFLTGIKSKAIPVTDREGPQDCETSRQPHFLENWLTDGDEVVSFTRRPPFTPAGRFLLPWYSFLFDTESTPWP
jgi:hypothetical protein